jgi:hypothetical protein
MMMMMMMMMFFLFILASLCVCVHTHVCVYTHTCVYVCVCVYEREEKWVDEREAKRLILAAKRVQRGLKLSKVLYTLSKVLYRRLYPVDVLWALTFENFSCVSGQSLRDETPIRFVYVCIMYLCMPIRFVCVCMCACMYVCMYV